jgi:hypothetical protein
MSYVRACPSSANTVTGAAGQARVTVSGLHGARAPVVLVATDGSTATRSATGGTSQGAEAERISWSSRVGRVGLEPTTGRL